MVSRQPSARKNRSFLVRLTADSCWQHLADQLCLTTPLITDSTCHRHKSGKFQKPGNRGFPLMAGTWAGLEYGKSGEGMVKTVPNLTAGESNQRRQGVPGKLPDVVQGS
jgi:hypothetical protein